MKKTTSSKKGAKASDAKNLSIVTQPADFFKEQLNKALENQKVKIDPHTEFYLVDLLSRFMFAESLFAVNENGTKREETLALLFQNSMAAADTARKQQGLRRLGDISLYTAGFFSDHLSTKIVDVDYYIGMGRNAYGNLSRIGIGASFQQVFAELAQSFHKCVDVLAEVSEGFSGKDAVNILRQYELWLKTRSERAEKSLKEVGIIPNSLVKPDWQ